MRVCSTTGLAWVPVLCCATLSTSFLAGCATTQPSWEPPAVAASEWSAVTNFQATVTEVERLLSTAGHVPSRLCQEEPVYSNTDFVVGRLLSALPNVRIRDGYVLDYVYCYDWLGGQPVVYARPSGAVRYSTYREYDRSSRGVGEGWLNPQFLAFLEPDGSPESFVQLVTLAMLCEQFYLYWHACYGDERILAERSGVREVLRQWNEAASVEFKEKYDLVLQRLGQERADKWRAKEVARNHPEFPALREPDVSSALSLDPSPRVAVVGGMAIVQLVYATNWGGLIRVEWGVTPSRPHRVIGVKTTTVAHYDCGIMF
jgi:hypothetical protein